MNIDGIFCGELWDNRTSEWKELFGECGPHSVAAFCNDEGTKFNCISITWYEENMRYTVTWNSYGEILQSDRCVIGYEYDHGLRSDNVPALKEQEEQLKKEIETIHYMSSGFGVPMPRRLCYL